MFRTKRIPEGSSRAHTIEVRKVNKNGHTSFKGTPAREGAKKEDLEQMECDWTEMADKRVREKLKGKQNSKREWNEGKETKENQRKLKGEKKITQISCPQEKCENDSPPPPHPEIVEQKMASPWSTTKGTKYRCSKIPERKHNLTSACRS